VDGWDIAGASSPASVVGGDLFGYYESRMSTGQVAVAVGDVSGHGMPAALLMTLTVGLLGAESRSSDSPAQVLSHLDTALRPHCLRSHLNVAVCYAILHRDGTVRIANAGSIAPLVRWSEGRVEWLDAHGLPLGVELAQETVSECRIQLRAGQVLVMLTDGLLEAKNKAGEMFGFERFEQALSHAPREAVSSASAMHNYLLTALHNYITPVEPEDDVTVIVMSKH